LLEISFALATIFFAANQWFSCSVHSLHFETSVILLLKPILLKCRFVVCFYLMVRLVF